MIKSRLGLNETIMARKCTVHELPTADAKLFFKHNHLAGFRGGAKNSDFITMVN